MAGIHMSTLAAYWKPSSLYVSYTLATRLKKISAVIEIVFKKNWTICYSLTPLASLSLVMDGPHKLECPPFIPHLSKPSCSGAPSQMPFSSWTISWSLPSNMPPLETLCFSNGVPVVPCITIILVPSPPGGYKWLGLYPAYLCIALPPPMPSRLLDPCRCIFEFDIWRTCFPKDTSINS